MAKITATTTFRHGHDTFEEGTEHDVPVVLAGFFVGNGWATSDDPELAELVPNPPAAHVELEVDDVTVTSGVTDAE